MRKQIKEFLYPPLYDLGKYYYFRFFKGSFFAKDQLDKKLKKYINYENGYFIELGANNGFSQSNTLYFEIKRNWRGILVEPCPNLYVQCCYFRNRERNFIFCNACVGFDYTEKYVDINYGNLMTTSESLVLDIPDGSNFYEKRDKNTSIDEKSLKFGSLACTLDTIMAKSNAPKKIDLLSIDVEGAELSVLSGVNYKKYQFKYIVVETRAPAKVIKFLAERSYRFEECLSKHDLLFSHFAEDQP